MPQMWRGQSTVYASSGIGVKSELAGGVDNSELSEATESFVVALCDSSMDLDNGVDTFELLEAMVSFAVASCDSEMSFDDGEDVGGMILEACEVGLEVTSLGSTTGGLATAGSGGNVSESSRNRGLELLVVG